MNYIVYNSIEDILKMAEGDGKHLESDRAKRGWMVLSNGSNYHFSGKTSEVCEGARSEHSYEANLINEKMSSVMSDDFMKKRFTFQNKQMVGQRVDIPRYLSGDLRCWFATKKIRRVNHAVRVYASIGGNAHRGSSELAINGALACSVVDAIESEGVNVELWGVTRINHFFSDFPDKEYQNDRDCADVVHLIKLKDSCEYCDLGRIGWVIGNDKFFRNIIFKSLFNYADSKYVSNHMWTVAGGMGHACDFKKNMIIPDGEYTKENTIVIPNVYSASEARDWFNNEFNKEEE